jgi:hypothetical protein
MEIILEINILELLILLGILKRCPYRKKTKKEKTMSLRL